MLGASYDSSAPYFGAHLGVGRKLAVNNEAGEIDLYGKLYWNRVGSDDFVTRAGERISLDAVDSVRSRLGARYTHSMNENAKAYVGAAWQHEFDGQTGGTVNTGQTGNVAISNPAELKGSSAFLETGLTLTPSANVNIDLGVFGMAGQQEGFGGTIGLRLDF